MHSVPIEIALPIVRSLAGRKAYAFAHRSRLYIHEREDIESQLVLAFLSRGHCFNSNRASIQTFASTLMDRELISVLRRSLALRRQCRTPPDLAGGPTSASTLQFRIDIERATSSLPLAVTNTISALRLLSSSEAAEALGCSRQALHKRKLRIRDAFLAAGIDANYFSRGRKQ